ncbi:uncharacterized protein G6M90_00g031860 [Metarhizium brunneum]|uniref:Uncharacterized protein n=1 Tax=Metarhizium brunneum TaxID=500148 RepID=A0A7D5YYI3_9HYPO
MKYLNILTACAGLAIAVPTLNPRQSEIDEADKICKSRGITKDQCHVYKQHCQFIEGITEPDQLNYCVKVLGTDCKDDGQCGQGYECREHRYRPNQRTCYPKKKQSQAGKQESASSTKEPTQDNKQDSTSPAKNQTQAREQELASQQTEINKIEKICQKRGLTKGQCLTYRSYCKENMGIVELDQLKHCVEVLGTPCRGDDQCGHGFECYKEASAPYKDGVCDTKQSQAGEQESASTAKKPTQDTTTNIATPTKELTQDTTINIAAPTKEPTQDTTANIATPTKEPTQDNKQDSTSPETDETDKICKSRGISEDECSYLTRICQDVVKGKPDQFNHCMKVILTSCDNDNECDAHGLACLETSLKGSQRGACFPNIQPESQAGKQESASSTKKPTQDTTTNIAAPTKEPTQDTTKNVATPTKEPTQNTTTNVATPSRPCTKKPIKSSEKNSVVGAKSTQA